MKIKFVMIFVTIFYFTSCDSAPKNPLIGVWELEASSWNGENMTLEEPKMVKVFTNNHVIFNYYEPNLIENETLLATAFGNYSFADGKLKEVIKNHTRSDNIGNEYDIEVTMGAQNNSYTQTLTFGEDVVLVEKWKRIE